MDHLSSIPASSLQEGDNLQTRLDWRDVLAPVLILAIAIAFKISFESSLPYTINPLVIERTGEVLNGHSPLAILWPQELDAGRYHWVPASLLPFYVLSLYFSTFQIYLILSSVAAVTAYFLARFAGRTKVFSVTLMLCLLFGTQLSYAATLGLTLLHYIVLTYISINLYAIYSYLSRPSGRILPVAFIFSLTLLALSTELWINYAIGLVLSFVFIFYWAGIHGNFELRKRVAALGISVLAALMIYLPIRMSVAGQYMGPGAEEELILTYSSYIIIAEDFVGNFFTFLYMALSNFLPSFLVSSNSMTVFGAERIVAEQNGYHQEFQHLTVMNHHFFWRYLAGSAVTLFLAAGYVVFRRSQVSRSFFYPIVLCGMMIVVTGFCTYLLIKFRPYNSIPALSYKAIISIYGVALLMSFLLESARERFFLPRTYWIVVCLTWSILLIGAVTRPGMINVQLQNVGLSGYGDPLKVLATKLHFNSGGN